jgi:hypothetical protein
VCQWLDELIVISASAGLIMQVCQWLDEPIVVAYIVAL